MRYSFRAKRRLAGLAGLVAQQPTHALLSQPPLPAPFRWTSDTSLSDYLEHRKSVGGEKNDPGPQNVFLWTIAITDGGSQTLAVASGKDNANPDYSSAISFRLEIMV
jgi:hypothetical protein